MNGLLSEDIIHVKAFPEPPLSVPEIRRYAGLSACSREDISPGGNAPENEESSSAETLLRECIDEALPCCSYKVSWRILGTEALPFMSEDLSRALRGASKCILFAATVGPSFDRLLRKYARLSPSKTLFFQAIGAERAESLCEAFCREISGVLNEEMPGFRLLPRFSPGYGDLSLEVQRDVFSLLSLSHTLGITLSDSLLMSPSKSVTAVMGIGKDS